MSKDDRFVAAAVFSVFGTGIGVGLLIAGFIAGIETRAGAALSSTGTTAVLLFLVLTLVLADAVRRRKRISGNG